MSTELIFCPACNHKLRVPGDLMGQRVQCPKCNTEFTAPPLTAAPEGGDDRFFAEPHSRSEGDAERERSQPLDDWDRRDEEQSRRQPGPSVVPPGICLIVVSLLGLLSSLARVALGFADKQMVQQLFANGPFGQVPPGFDLRTMFLVMGIVFSAISLATLAGGVAMMRRRLHALAVLGSIAAMINITDFCCVLGLPVGIWALIVLFNPDVRDSFR